MNISRIFRNNKTFALLILFISTFGFILRAICCFWGYPYCLHPDEGVIVEPAIDMLARHSWQAYSYFRPDQVEIKLDAILFTMLSWIRYHKPAYEAFQDHQFFFYVIARGLTAFFGTAIIPLAVSVVGRLLPVDDNFIKRTSQICVACTLAFCSLFVHHSAYATPDIILSFFILLFSWFCLDYLEKGDMYSLIACAITIGLGVATKYPGAIMSIPVAIIVIYRAIRVENKPQKILIHGIVGMVIVAVTVFVVAPNLFTDYQAVYEHFIAEANGKNEGAYGLGFTGNLVFYFKTFCKDIGAVSAFFFTSGIVYILKHRTTKWLVLISGLSYWVCISVIELHWVRWCFPHYVFYVIVVSIGLGNLFCFVKKRADLSGSGKVCFVISCSVLGVFLLNILLSGICYTKFSRVQDTRLTAMRYLSDHDINKENSIYTTYTPFSLEDGLKEKDLFDFSEGYVNVIPFYSVKRYYITNISLKERNLLERERLRDRILLSESIEQKYPLIHEEIPDGNYDTTPSILMNIYSSVRYLLTACNSTGSAIQIYDLEPRFVSIKNLETGEFLNYSKDDQGALRTEMTREPSKWLIYEDRDGTRALINADYSDEKYLTYALIPGNTGLILEPDNLGLSSAENMRELSGQWTVVEEDEGCCFVNSNKKALSCNDDGLCLEESGERTDRQRWLIFDYKDQ